MPQHALPARLPLLRASDAVASSHYLSLPGVIEHTSWGHVSERAMALQIARHLPDASDQRWRWGRQQPAGGRRDPRRLPATQ
jgi:ribosomal-protein-alanine N-acetyltransferase